MRADVVLISSSLGARAGGNARWYRPAAHIQKPPAVSIGGGGAHTKSAHEQVLHE
jgi:hypothetical protein